MAGWINPLAKPMTGVLPKTASWDTPRITSNPVTAAPRTSSTSNATITSGGIDFTSARAAQRRLTDAATAESARLSSNSTDFTTPPSAADTAAARAAAAEAERAAKVRQYQGEVTSKLAAYNNMFGGLYGRINAAAADQEAKTRTNYGQQRQSLTDDYNAEVPQIDMSYYLSGAGDSSFKLGGLGKAEKAYTGSLSKVKQSEDTDLAAIGKELAGTTGKYQAQQKAIENVRKQAAESDDPAELKRLIADVTNNMLGLEADNATFDTEAGFRGKVQSVSKTDDLAPVRENLKSLMNGAANPALKRQIASDLIANANASDKAKKDLFEEFVNGKA